MRTSVNKKTAGFLAAAAIILISLLILFFSFREQITRTENTLGPASSSLTTVQRIRLTIQCSRMLDRLTQPVNPETGRFLLEISEQEGTAAVIEKIAEGLGCDPQLLRTYLIYTGADRRIRPGRYVLSGTMTVPQVTDLVTAAGRSLVQFAFLSGMRLEELAALIDDTGFAFTGSEFLSAAKNYPAALHPSGGRSLEGYFVPGTYEMSRGISLEDFLANFVSVFRRRIQEPYEAAFKANGLTLHQAVIMGSMIAREAMSESEYGTIASVFYNRIAAGMKFESDPTAQYAIGWDPGSRSWWKNPLTAADVSINSAYNTYVTDGFPPGPICSPSPAVLEAVADPEHTDYLYFRARCDNTPYHNFSRTYEEHVSFGCP